jgi:hypothetical protein
MCIIALQEDSNRKSQRQWPKLSLIRAEVELRAPTTVLLVYASSILCNTIAEEDIAYR